MYEALLQQIAALLDGEEDMVCAMANTSAAIMHALPGLNWAGFYIVKDGLLVLGPFQGRVACTRIAYGKGVCGTAWKEKRALCVPNVHEFPGHIACDGASNSEAVLPILRESGEVLGVLDLDSPEYRRFGAEDMDGLAGIAAMFGRY